MSSELGAMLVKAGKISPDQVDDALEIIKNDYNETFQSALV